jgi:signal transduction histidine kinase
VTTPADLRPRNPLQWFAWHFLPRQLGRRLKVTVSFGLWLAVALFGAWTFHEQSAQAMAGLESQAAALARNVALSCENPILTDKLDVIEEMALRSAAFPQVRDIRALDIRGMTLSHVTREAGKAPRAQFDPPGKATRLPLRASAQTSHDAATGNIVAWHPVMAGQPLGWVRLEYSVDELQAMRQRIWTSTIVAGLLAGLCSVGLLTLLLNRPMRNLRKATDFAVGLDRIEGQQIPVRVGTEEMMSLARALNQASGRLLTQRQEIDAGIEALRRKEAALADTNEQLHTIFSLSPDALMSFDSLGHVSFANAAFSRILGVSPAAVVGLPAHMVDHHLRTHAAEPDDYPGLDRYFPDAQDRSSLPVRPRLVLSRPRHQVLEIVGQLGHSATVSRLLYVRDVTHESEVDRMKSEFVATAAHELRTPMTSIHACLELLGNSDIEDAQRTRLVAMANRQSDAMIGIINDLLNLSRIEARSIDDFNFQPVQLAREVQHGVHDFLPPGGRRAPVWNHQPSDSDPLVRADPAKLRQVLRNLLSNAYKYSMKGEVQVDMVLDDVGAKAPRVGFQVTDHGIGMSPDQLAQVFERFYRADTSGHVLGTGLGMSIAREIITLMEGTIELRSTLGEGTTVTVWLPRAAAASTAPGEAGTLRAAVPAANAA